MSPSSGSHKMAEKSECDGTPPSKSSNEPPSSHSEDPELDELLDSALEDFSKPPNPGPVEGATAKAKDDSKDASTKANLSFPASPFELPPGQEAMFDDVFNNADFMDDATKHFEEAMKQLLGGNPDMLNQIEKLSAAADNIPANGENPDAEKDFVNTLQDTIGSLAANAQNMQEADIKDDDLMQAMASMGLDGGEDGGDGDFLPMMKTMMQSLLSKDVLYPSLKEIADKYPEWLAENKDKITSVEYERYNKQLDVMKVICIEFENEKPDDTDDIKTKRFETILQNMQAMQECGQPPKDIVGEMAPGLEFDENGLPKMPPGMGADQCSIM